MKRIHILLVLLGIVTACNDDFLERYPLDELNDENFWGTAQELELYNNKLYENYIIGFGYDWGTTKVEPYGYYQAAAYGDVITDNAAPDSYSKVAANEYIDYISKGSGTGGWSWSNMREVNYFLDNYKRGDLDPSVSNVYLGEVLYFKSFDYFDKVKTFGDVPWITSALETDSPELMGARTPRAQVMDSVMILLNKAIQYLPAKGEEKPGRISKDVALHLKSRIGLYEGTYRKYHASLGLNGEAFLRASVEASEQLINGGAYGIYSTGDVNNDYNDLFAKYSYADNKEIILWKEYSADERLGVAFSRYYTQNLRHKHGATRDFVEEYLCIDGLPITESSQYQGDASIADELTNRDPRLRQTICNFGEYQLQTGVQGSGNAPLPNIPGLSGNKCPTGYRVAKWFINDPDDWNRVTNGMQAAPIFRYAEVLLNYAEAKYELEGSLSQAIVDQTINTIRDRVGMAHLMVGAIPNDAKIDGDYSKYCDYVPSPLLREIRRERRVELSFENFRWDDLMRWKAGKFLEKPVEGIKFDQNVFPNVVIEKDVFLSEDGYILPYAQTLPNGVTFDERQYLFPIPIEDLVLNSNLTQNPGWQSK